MKRACCIALAVLLLLFAAGILAGALAVKRSGLSARPEPPAVEAAMARMVRRLATDRVARLARNPVPATPAAIAEGRAHFADHCASCHANDGSGNTALGRRLYPRAPDMRLPATQDLTDGELFHVIENGIRFTGMPGWGGAVSPEASWQLVHFIRRLPKLTPQEVLEMERLNPKSPGEWKEMQEDEAFLQGETVKPAEPSHHAH